MLKNLLETRCPERSVDRATVLRVEKTPNKPCRARGVCVVYHDLAYVALSYHIHQQNQNRRGNLPNNDFSRANDFFCIVLQRSKYAEGHRGCPTAVLDAPENRTLSKLYISSSSKVHVVLNTACCITCTVVLLVLYSYFVVSYLLGITCTVNSVWDSA